MWVSITLFNSSQGCCPLSTREISVSTSDSSKTPGSSDSVSTPGHITDTQSSEPALADLGWSLLRDTHRAPGVYDFNCCAHIKFLTALNTLRLVLTIQARTVMPFPTKHQVVWFMWVTVKLSTSLSYKYRNSAECCQMSWKLYATKLHVTGLYVYIVYICTVYVVYICTVYTVSL